MSEPDPIDKLFDWFHFCEENDRRYEEGWQREFQRLSHRDAWFLGIEFERFLQKLETHLPFSAEISRFDVMRAVEFIRTDRFVEWRLTDDEDVAIIFVGDYRSIEGDDTESDEAAERR